MRVIDDDDRANVAGQSGNDAPDLLFYVISRNDHADREAGEFALEGGRQFDLILPACRMSGERHVPGTMRIKGPREPSIHAGVGTSNQDKIVGAISVTNMELSLACNFRPLA